MSSSLSVSASIEAKILETLRALVPSIPSVGFLEVASEGALKRENLTSFQVRVYNLQQLHESMEMFAVSAEIRLNVEQAESANGGIFRDAHETFALWLERVMLGDGCKELSTDEASVDGLQRTGDDKDFDTTDGVWYVVWNLTLSGRIKIKKEA